MPQHDLNLEMEKCLFELGYWRRYFLFLSRIPKLAPGAPGTSPAILLITDFTCAVALGYGIKTYNRHEQGIMAQWFMAVSAVWLRNPG